VSAGVTRAQSQQPCTGSSPPSLGQANSLFRNNSDPNTTVTTDASQLTEQQKDPDLRFDFVTTLAVSLWPNRITRLGQLRYWSHLPDNLGT
jgi:hypothetical protein